MFFFWEKSTLLFLNGLFNRDVGEYTFKINPLLSHIFALLL